jgi:hypothetical protein
MNVIGHHDKFEQSGMWVSTEDEWPCARDDLAGIGQPQSVFNDLCQRQAPIGGAERDEVGASAVVTEALKAHCPMLAEWQASAASNERRGIERRSARDRGTPRKSYVADGLGPSPQHTDLRVRTGASFRSRTPLLPLSTAACVSPDHPWFDLACRTTDIGWSTRLVGGGAIRRETPRGEPS